MSGPTPVNGWSRTISTPDCSIATRSLFDGSLTSNIEYIRAVTLVGATRMASATTSGMAASSRRSLSTMRVPTPATRPTQALRVKVSASATISAGITSTVQVREPPKNVVPSRRKTSRAAAAQATSISTPE